MAWIPTLFFYASKLRMERFIDGEIKAGYPKVYNILSAFSYNGSNFSTITVDGWQKMESAVRSARITAFKGYVSAIENVSISEVQSNTEYYSVETPGERRITISGTSLPGGATDIAVLQGSTPDYYATIAEMSPVTGSQAPVYEGAFSLIWETTEEDYQIVAKPYLMAVAATSFGPAVKFILKPPFSEASENGIAFDDGGEWEMVL